MQRIRTTGLLVAACATLAVGLGATASSAAASTAQWTGGASTPVATPGANPPLNPSTATRVPCANQSVGLPDATEALGLPTGITARTAYAMTGAEPLGAAPIAQTAAGAAGVEGLALRTADGTVVIGVDAARSAASGSCLNGAPVLGGTSQVTGLTLNGHSITADQQLTDLTDAISGSPLNALVWVKLNEQVKTATGLVQNAVHIKVLQAAGDSPLAEVFIAQSAVSSQSACDVAAPGNT